MKREAESKAVKEEYRRARAALLRRISRARKKGLDIEEFKVPKIPKKITKGSIRNIKKASEKFTQFKRSIPKYGDVMSDLIDQMIYSAQTWVDDHPLSAIRLQNEARIQHRGDEARSKFNEYSLSYNEKNREILQHNVVRTWRELVDRLERFLLESDQYKYDGNLIELTEIFVKMLEPVGEDGELLNYKEIADMADNYVDSNDWIEWED